MLDYNLDCMTVEELWEFHRNYSHRSTKRAKELGLTGKGSIKTMVKLACYAVNKAVGMQCRLQGRIQEAFVYEQICERLYSELPSIAKW